ncbi:max dimerization protein 1-like [Sycon ciliatum]|uniref:max dimerization protein 1-like n=1 Tax=Sycon ciliatum TaxID=27933 RepID=UPI0020ABF945|eukprot:scpid80458/ scgid17080/ 
MSITQTATTGPGEAMKALCMVADSCLHGFSLSQTDAKTQAVATSMLPVSPSSSVNTSHGQASKPRSRPPKNRETHNKKEKQRRDHMRSNFSDLRGTLTDCSTTNDTDYSKSSVLNLLQAASSRIRELENEAKDIGSRGQRLREHNQLLMSQLRLLGVQATGHLNGAQMQPQQLATTAAGHAAAVTSAASIVAVPTMIGAMRTGNVSAGGDHCDVDGDINVTDDHDAESTDHHGGSRVNDCSRLQAIMSASASNASSPSASSSSPGGITAATVAATTRPMDIQFTSMSVPVQSGPPLYGVSHDIAAAATQMSPNMPYVFPTNLHIPLGVPSAHTPTYTSFNLPPQYHHQLMASLTPANAAT